MLLLLTHLINKKYFEGKKSDIQSSKRTQRIKMLKINKKLLIQKVIFGIPLNISKIIIKNNELIPNC